MPKISKILYIVTQSDMGGAQRYVFDLATNISPDNFEAIVAAGGNDVLFDKLLQKRIKAIHVSRLVRPIRPLTDLLCILELRKIITEIKPDIIHLNSSKASIVGSFASLLCRRRFPHRLIYTVHGFVFNEPLPAPIKLAYFLLEKFTATLKDKLICIYRQDMENAIAKKIAPAEKFVTVYNGISPISYFERQAARKKLGLPDDKIIIGTIANFYPAKGINFLIEAANLTKDILPDAKYAVIGEGLLRKQLEEKISSLKLNETFHLAGPMPDAARLLHAFDIFILPSVKEGLPFSLIEAMTAKLPCIATRVGGVSEIINDGKNGLLVDPAVPKQLAEAIIKLCQNKNLADYLAGQAELDAKSKFSLQRMISETAEAYRGISDS